MSNYITYNPYITSTKKGGVSAVFLSKKPQNFHISNTSQAAVKEYVYYSFGLSCSPLLHYRKAYRANSYGNAIANLLGSLHTGKERDSETGFSYFGARYYDSDILTGWLSVDPMADKYPGLSPYAYCGWNPVRLVDPDGRDICIVGDDAYREKVENLILKLQKSGIAGRYLVYNALKSDNTFTLIQPNENNKHLQNEIFRNGSNGEKTAIIFDVNSKGVYDEANGSVQYNSLTILAHELSHFVFPQKGRLLKDGCRTNIPAGEVKAVEWENMFRHSTDMDLRKKYDGINVYGKEIENSKYKNYFNLSSKPNYMAEPKDVGVFKMIIIGSAKKPYGYKARGSYIDVISSWRESRYSIR